MGFCPTFHRDKRSFVYLIVMFKIRREKEGEEILWVRKYWSFRWYRGEMQTLCVK